MMEQLEAPVAGKRLSPDPASFRDPASLVLSGPEGVRRLLTPSAASAWRVFHESPLFAILTDDGSIVRTAEESVPEDYSSRFVAMLRHERIPFVSYPYEWPFGMLKRAALFHLELMQRALAHDFILKDASAYNVQWSRLRPTFIDIPSFVPYRAGTPWIGYRQFCQHFLYPLLLQAHRGVDFQPLLRSLLDGIPVDQMRRLLSMRDWIRRGVLTHVVLHDMLQAKFEDASSAGVAQLRMTPELILQNVKGLLETIEGLSFPQSKQNWVGYREQSPYSPEQIAAKDRFIEHVAAQRRRHRVWDLGANTGAYTRIAAAHADLVVAMDSQHAVMERMYDTFTRDGLCNVLPLVVDVANPSPDQGWRGNERPSLPRRGRPDLTLALALAHHVRISANVPLASLVEWLADLGGDLVIEFVTREDPMVKRLLANREDVFDDYQQGTFEELLARHYAIVAHEELVPGRRFIYHCAIGGKV